MAMSKCEVALCWEGREDQGRRREERKREGEGRKGRKVLGGFRAPLEGGLKAYPSAEGGNARQKEGRAKK